jgi:hypothetical protein
MAASQNHAAGMNNFGRCLEYGQEVEPDLLRAAKYYRLASELQNADGENNFGICLERGIGVRSNVELAAEYYRRAADHGHADGANNFGFCLEHGRGVRQNIEMAAEYYQLAANRRHPEAEQNRRRCLRLLGRWTVPDRSREASEQKPSLESHPITDDRPLGAFIKAKDATEFLEDWTRGGLLGAGKTATVTLARDPHGPGKRAVKTLYSERYLRYFEREKSIHERLNHPLIVGFEQYFARTKKRPPAIVTEFVPNGSLAHHLPSGDNSDLCRLAGGTRIAIVVAGIVLAMRYLHSRRIIHRDLKPANIFIDWDWMPPAR